VNVFLNNTLYLGQTILDLSKHSMNEFHYKVIKPMYGENIKLLFTDTGGGVDFGLIAPSPLKTKTILKTQKYILTN
jgi:hypothetical protein